MATRQLIQDAPYKSPLTDRQGLMSLRWLSWFDSITRRARALLTDVSADPPNLAAGTVAQVTVTVPGANAGDLATASFVPAAAGVVIFANVTAANTVTVTFWNVTAGAINLASGTLRVRVEAWQ